MREGLGTWAAQGEQTAMSAIDGGNSGHEGAAAATAPDGTAAAIGATMAGRAGTGGGLSGHTCPGHLKSPTLPVTGRLPREMTEVSTQGRRGALVPPGEA